MTRSGGLMVCGTTSDAGKSTIVTGLCRVLARRGVKVAPFKAQNMALNSAITPSGHEIGRAQAAQALAAGLDPEVAMNPILLKPSTDRTSQVVVLGRPWATLPAGAYHDAKSDLWPIVRDQLDDLRSRFDVVLCEGAGSPAEINLIDRDIVNLRVARHADFPAVLVGDIERGGVFAALYGTVAILPDELRGLIQGFVINKFRGDPALLGSGPHDLERRTGVPTLGVLPWLSDVGIDAEDSLALRNFPRSGGAGLDVAVIEFPRISNFTDLDPLSLEDDVAIRLVRGPAAVGAPDLLVLPGSKATLADLDWLHQTGLAAAISTLSPSTTVLGICGGYQMLGREIVDRDAVESTAPRSETGLGLLPARTTFGAAKKTAMVTGTALRQPICGYFIHHGRTEAPDSWIDTEYGPEGSRAGGIYGTSMHGLFEADGFRAAFLQSVAARAGKTWIPSGKSFAAARQARFETLADVMEEHLDMTAIESLMQRP
jgi:adenosylcobyric acid synthase